MNSNSLGEMDLKENPTGGCIILRSKNVKQEHVS